VAVSDAALAKSLAVPVAALLQQAKGASTAFYSIFGAS
jgi:hypothetical protein